MCLVVSLRCLCLQMPSRVPSQRREGVGWGKRGRLTYLRACHGPSSRYDNNDERQRARSWQIMMAAIQADATHAHHSRI